MVYKKEEEDNLKIIIVCFLKKMKLNLYIQNNGKEFLAKDIETKVKEELKVKGIVQSKVEQLNIYFKPETNDVYFTTLSKDGELVEHKL